MPEEQSKLDQNRAIARRIPLETFAQGRIEVIDEVCAPDIKNHGDMPPGVPQGREGLKAVAKELRKAFPDLKYALHHQIAEGDMVAGFVTISGTNKGEWFGMPATNKHAEWSEAHFVKVVNGKVTEHWGVIDQLGMLRQLGLAPAPQGAPVSR